MMYETDVYFMPRAVRQFFRCQKKRNDLGFIDTARHELIVFMKAHLAAGHQFDPGYQEILYCNGVLMYMREDKGTWLVYKVILTEKALKFTPVYLWSTIKRGITEFAQRIFRHWTVTKKKEKPSSRWAWLGAW